MMNGNDKTKEKTCPTKGELVKKLNYDKQKAVDSNKIIKK